MTIDFVSKSQLVTPFVVNALYPEMYVKRDTNGMPAPMPLNQTKKHLFNAEIYDNFSLLMSTI